MSMGEGGVDKKNREITSSGASADAIETAGEVFPDGQIIELVRERDSNQLLLLHWDAVASVITQTCEHAGRIYVPIRAHGALQHLRLPREPRAFGSTRQLFDELCSVFISYLAVDQATATTLAYFIISTSLIDALEDAPRLSVVAPAGAPAADLLRLLEALCRRAIRLAEISCATFQELPTELQPTLLVSLPSLNRAMEKVIRSSNQRGLHISVGGQLRETFCAKVICTPIPLRDPASIGDPLQITLLPRLVAAPAPLDRPTIERLADEFQSKLLAFRLANRSKFAPSGVDVSSLSAATQPLARMLASCVGGDETLQAGVVEMLRDHDADITAARAEDLSAILLEALLVCCHEARESGTGKIIAEIANAILTARGDPRRLSAESIGWLLKGLGFHTEPIGRAGRGLRFANSIRSRIHELARGYGVCSVREIETTDCPYCDWRVGSVAGVTLPAGGERNG
jgi:hypothetical protein